MTKYYVLHIWGDVDPELQGPFDTAGERDNQARFIHNEKPDDGIFRLNVDEKGNPTVYSYAFGELGEE